VAEWFEIEGGLDDMRAVAQALRDAGHALNEHTTAVLGEIERLEATEPWGTDKYRKEFLDGYQQPAGDGGPPFNEAVKTGLREAGNDLADLGDNTMMAMTDVQVVEEDNAHRIGDVKAV
jgi:hypothetical protein